MTSNDDRDAMRRDLYLKVGWRLIPLLIIVYAAAFIDRSNIAFAKLTFMKDVGVDEAAYGLGGGLFYLGYCLFEVPSNLLLARIGAKRTLMRIMILWSLFSAGFAFIAQPWHFFGLRFMLGAAEAGLGPDDSATVFFMREVARSPFSYALSVARRLGAVFLFDPALFGLFLAALIVVRRREARRDFLLPAYVILIHSLLSVARR